jgi:hypothetical protein
MPITNDKYDQLKIDRLKYFLQNMADKGQAKPFEIFVDSLKVVPKTEDVKDFDHYEFYMNEDTEKIRILIYNSSLTPRNDQYCFYLQDNKLSKPLNGIGDLDGIIQEKLIQRDKEYELTRLKEDYEKTKQELNEAEDYIEELEEKLSLATNDKHKIKNIDIVDVAGALLGRWAQNSPQLSALGLGSLAGGSNEAHVNPEVESEASFKKKEEENETSEKDKDYLQFLNQLSERLNETEFHTTMLIIDQLTKDTTQINAVADLLGIQKS